MIIHLEKWHLKTLLWNIIYESKFVFDIKKWYYQVGHIPYFGDYSCHLPTHSHTSLSSLHLYIWKIRQRNRPHWITGFHVKKIAWNLEYDKVTKIFKPFWCWKRNFLSFFSLKVTVENTQSDKRNKSEKVLVAAPSLTSLVVCFWYFSGFVFISKRNIVRTRMKTIKKKKKMKFWWDVDTYLQVSSYILSLIDN